MARGTYPAAADLAVLFGSAGITVPAGMDLAGAVDQARAEFERASGRVLLAASATRTYDLPASGQRVLPLRADLTSLTSLTISGVAKTAGTDFRLRTPNQPPYWAVEFAAGVLPRVLLASSPAWDAVSITGRWGLGATIPEDAWGAILGRAAVLRLPEVRYGLTLGLVSWERKNNQENFGPSPLAYLDGKEVGWNAVFTATVDRYRNVRAGAG